MQSMLLMPLMRSTPPFWMPELRIAYDRMENHHRMHRPSRCALLNLLTTRYARRRDDRVWRCVHRGKEPHPADLHRQVVMLTLEAERAGHAATAGVQHVHRRAGNSLEEPDASRRRVRGFLMT